ncbi:hypothetical protein [Mycolicibacterium sediminis]|uniref:Uncharacterized protein n=1 Tax=Mycolicibacterium sediminis TaxID=1286180 RepID=A0A7I7QZ55_9MYCO|nr:hypothetical protein [Mycolicibacterium sediminis]BBY31669.1 hypothetical protein MSEDJ_57650 [Mycolicibacterium sediminis]
MVDHDDARETVGRSAPPGGADLDEANAERREMRRVADAEGARDAVTANAARRNDPAR